MVIEREEEELREAVGEEEAEGTTKEEMIEAVGEVAIMNVVGIIIEAVTLKVKVMEIEVDNLIVVVTITPIAAIKCL